MKQLKDIESNLTTKDKNRLERKYKEYARQSKELEFQNATDKLNLERDVHIENEKVERMKLKQKNCIQTLKNTRDNNKIKNLLNIEKNGYTFKKIGLFFTLISSITSMFGITSNCLDGASVQDIIKQWGNNENISFVIIGFLFFIGELFTGYLLSKQPLIKEYFIDKTHISKFMYFMIYVYCGFIYITSVISNYIFWYTLTKSTLVSVVYSFIFDIGGMFTIFYSDYFINLRSKNIFDDLTQEEAHSIDELPFEDISEYINTENTIERTEIENKSDLDQLSMFDKVENKNTENKQNIKEKPYNKEMTIEIMQGMIDNMPDGEIIKPIKIGMSHNPNYRNWIKKMNNVNYDGKNYIKYDNVKMLENYKNVIEL